MRLSQSLVIGSAVGLAAALAVVFARRARHAHAPEKAAGGAMFVGAIDEVELAAGLARPMRADVSPESFDPEEIPSEHAEINELRRKMPFG